MKIPPFKDIQFVKSATKAAGYPDLKMRNGQPMLEIAVAGRSNVGKSSLLNDLFRRKGLVKTSSTPGKTQLINFFTVDEQLCFVDLPGYGYADVPMKVRKQWGPMIEGYLDSRPHLAIMLFLFDIRRMPNEEDALLMDWIIDRKIPMILVLTKVDKLTQSQKVAQSKKILDAFECENLHYVYYSTLKHIGRHELVILLDRSLKEIGTISG